MRVFLTGATGYIGSAVARALKKRGHDVVGLARNAEAINKLRHADVRAVHGSLDTTNVIHEMVRDADAVIHTAQEQSAQGSALDTAFVEAVLDAIHDNHEAFIYTAGAWDYGSRGDAVLTEDAPLTPLKLVAWRAQNQERVHSAVAHGRKIRTVVIRPGIVYGDGGGITGMMAAQAAKGELRIVGDGENRWPLVRVDELADLYLRALEEAPAHSVYNGAHDHATYGAIARAVSRSAGGDGQVPPISLADAEKRMGGFAEALAADIRLDSSRAERELGWKPDRPSLIEELSGTTVV
jgi:nucleoside-diphosphate-sugar epimerase